LVEVQLLYNFVLGSAAVGNRTENCSGEALVPGILF